jgi:hypothetical protein
VAAGTGRRSDAGRRRDGPERRVGAGRYDAAADDFPEDPSDFPDGEPLLGELLSPEEPDDPSEDDVFSFDFSFDEPDASFDEPEASDAAGFASVDVAGSFDVADSLAAGRLSFL